MRWKQMAEQLWESHRRSIILLGALLVIWLILRRRKRRKLEVWARRARQLAADRSDREPLAGVTATDSEEQGTA